MQQFTITLSALAAALVQRNMVHQGYTDPTAAIEEIVERALLGGRKNELDGLYLNGAIRSPEEFTALQAERVAIATVLHNGPIALDDPRRVVQPLPVTPDPAPLT